MDFVLIDDVQSHHDILAAKLQWACGELHIPCRIALTTENWRDAVQYAEQAADGTVWFLDIELQDEINGVELCRRIQEKAARAFIVYVSAYQQYALECCQSHAFDFLLKPWTDTQLLSCLRAVVREQERLATGSFLTVTLGTRRIQLRQESILYFSKDRTIVTAHYQNGQTFSWRESLETLRERVKPGLFVQCHKSYLVGLSHVQEYRWSEDCLILDSGESIPISRRRIGDMKALLQNESMAG